MTDDVTSRLEGFVSVRAALLAGLRPVQRVLLRNDKPDDKALAWLKHEAGRREITVTSLPPEQLDNLASGTTHGGVMAEVGPRTFQRIESLVVSDAVPFVAMLDGLEDPFNFGQAVRALWAAGCDGLVVRPRNWFDAATVVARASAGASEFIPTAIAADPAEAADALRPHGLRVAVAIKTDATPLYAADLSGPLFLVIGGEKRGVTRAFRDRADIRVQIPYGREDFPQSLGTTTATAVLAFEVLRQRQVRR